MNTICFSPWITLIGMGLVFVAILLLWGLIEILMRLTAGSAHEEEAGEDGDAIVSANPLAPRYRPPAGNASSGPPRLPWQSPWRMQPDQPSSPSPLTGPWQRLAGHHSLQPA